MTAKSSVRRWMILGSLSLCSCGADPVNASWPSELELAYLVVVPEDWRGRLADLGISGPHALESAAVQSLELNPRARLFLVGIDQDLASNAHPRLGPSPAWSLGAISAELAADRSCDLAGWVHGDETLELPVDSEENGLHVYELSLETGAFSRSDETGFEGVLSLRADLEPCLGGRRLVMEDFAESRRENAEDFEIYGEVQYLDDETVLVTATGLLRAVRRGARDPAARTLFPADLPLPPAPSGSSWYPTAAALYGDGNSARGVLALTLIPNQEGSTLGAALFEIHLTPERFEAGSLLWSTDVPLSRSDPRIAKLVFDQDGRWVGVGPGLVISGTTSASRPQVFEKAATFDAFELVATGVNTHPFALAGRQILQWGSPFLGERGLEDFPLPGPSALNRRNDALAVSSDREGFVLDVLRTNAEISRGRPTASDWEDHPIPLGEAPAGCTARSECGRRLATQRGNFVVSMPVEERTSFLVAPEGCGNLYLVDPERECGISTPILLSEALHNGERDDGTLNSGVRRGDRVVISGERGRILDVRLEP